MRKAGGALGSARGLVFEDDDAAPVKKRRAQGEPNTENPTVCLIEVNSDDEDAPPPDDSLVRLQTATGRSLWDIAGGNACSILGVITLRGKPMNSELVNHGMSTLLQEARAQVGNEVWCWSSLLTRMAVQIMETAPPHGDGLTAARHRVRGLLGMRNRDWYSAAPLSGYMSESHGVCVAVLNLEDAHFATLQIFGREGRGYQAVLYDSIHTPRGSYSLSEARRFVNALSAIDFLPNNVPVHVDREFPQQPHTWECGAYARAAMQGLMYTLTRFPGERGIDPRIMAHMRHQHLPRDVEGD